MAGRDNYPRRKNHRSYSSGDNPATTTSVAVRTLPPEEGATIAVIGAGYVGLTTAACLSYVGHNVTCGDINESRVNSLNEGNIPIYEEGLDEIVRDGLSSGRLRFVAGASNAVKDAEFIFLCLPTPRQDDGTPDMSFISTVAAEIGPLINHGSVVVNKSTVPVGSAVAIERMIGRSDISVVSNPEFLREGTAVNDFFHPDRIVIGADDEQAAVRVSSLFRTLGASMLITDATTAETVKYAANAYLAMKISFANSIAELCEIFGADIKDVLLGVAYDHRIGFEYLKPGPGWGGSCLPKDTAALLSAAAAASGSSTYGATVALRLPSSLPGQISTTPDKELSYYDISLLEAIIKTNDSHEQWVVRKALSLLQDDEAPLYGVQERGSGSQVPPNGPVVAVWGVAFKAGTDDMRESPALVLISELVSRGTSIRVYDPTLRSETDVLPAGTVVCADLYSACEGASLLCIMTEWEEFRWAEFGKVMEVMASPKILDARNLLDVSAVRRMGFTYQGIGRK